MKKCKIAILSIAILSMIFMTGCNFSNVKNTESETGGRDTEELSKDNTEEVSTDDTEELFIDAGVPDDELSLMQKVLFNKEDYNEGQMIADVEGIYNDEHDRRVMFYVVDLDHDGKDEICLDYAGWILILHEIDGQIYGYNTTFRGFNPVYTDGTFKGSSGASSSSFCGNVSFTKDEFRYEDITGIEWDNNGNAVYYKNGDFYTGVETSKEEYDQIMSQYERIEAEEYDFTIENVLEYVK